MLNLKTHHNFFYCFSKILLYFYSPRPPLTFETVKKFMASPSLTLALRSSVKKLPYWIINTMQQQTSLETIQNFMQNSWNWLHFWLIEPSLKIYNWVNHLIHFNSYNFWQITMCYQKILRVYLIFKKSEVTIVKLW